MQKLNSMWILALVLVSCTHKNMPNSGSQKISSRFAQTELKPLPGQITGGTVKFEQMPNSTIGTYRIEGLDKKRVYQFSVVNNGDCQISEKRPSVVVYQFKSNKTGISESTFKTEDFSVSDDNALIGQSLLLASLDKKTGKKFDSFVACGPIQAMTSTDLAKSAP